MIIKILTSQRKISRTFNDFHPIYRWNKKLRENHLFIKFFKNHKNLESGDVLIIDYRYVRSSTVGLSEKSRMSFTINLFKKERKNFNTLIFFDSGDSTGSRCFSLINYVDVFWKKQVLKDKDEYLKDKGLKNWQCWLPDNLNSFDQNYDKPSKKDLKKIKIAWNISLCGYYDTNNLVQAFLANSKFSSLFLNSKFNSAFKYGHLLTSYRVSFNKQVQLKERYNYQRKKIKNILLSMSSNHNIKCEGKLPKKKYLEEIKKSKVIISPYGHGEICYRDFEAIVNGSLLIKPNVNHLETFPNLFIENVTYVPINWDGSNLEGILKKIENNPNEYLEIVEKAQSLFRESIESPYPFIKHLKNILS